MKDLNETRLVVAGGVSANSSLRQILKERCEKEGFEVFFPEISLCGDNAAMIGSQAYYEYLKGNIADTSLNGIASLSIE